MIRNTNDIDTTESYVYFVLCVHIKHLHSTFQLVVIGFCDVQYAEHRTPTYTIYTYYIVYSLHFRSSTILFLFRIYYTCISLIFILYFCIFYFCRVCVIILFQLHFKWCTHLLGFNASSFNHTGM